MNDLEERIKALCAEKGAVILAHNYVDAAIQDVADFTGDSLALSIQAQKCRAKTMVFCGVRFMAETAKILSPASKVLLPVSDAGCPMADMATAEAVAAYRKEHPGVFIVAYVNTTAAVKAEVDICCTSANADKVIKSIPANQEVLFLPDRNLGRNTAKALNRPMQMWPGYCPVHDQVTPEDIRAARAAHPKAKVMVHPECQPDVIALTDAALSTGGMINYVRDSAEKEFIVGTEMGIMHKLLLDNPDKKFYLLSPAPRCENMKKITLESIIKCLETSQEEIILPADLIERARTPIERMLTL